VAYGSYYSSGHYSDGKRTDMANQPDYRTIRRGYGLLMLISGIILCLFEKTRTISFMFIGFGMGLVSSSFQ